ncbi:MAG: ATP-binding protein [Dehalococcoidia bacterium]
MSTRYNIKTKRLLNNRHFWYISALTAFCALFYYLPSIGGVLGWTVLESVLGGLHNLAGIDFLGLVFFAPVVYVAYIWGVIPSIFTAILAMFILLPYAILEDVYPNALFKPTAFVIILSAVGAVVAMLQKSELEHRLRMKEMKCLYDIGNATRESKSIDEFLGKVVSLVPQAMQSSDETGVRIVFRNCEYTSPDFQKTPGKITEKLVVGDEEPGFVEIYSIRSNPYLKKRNHLTKTLAERIGGALRQMELEISLGRYYEQLETDVEDKTKDLENVQEKLIRSERLAAVGELASGVGHELRNPLNVIRNCAYLLNMFLTDKGDEEALNSLEVLDKQIDIANKIVTDLMDFTRIKPPSKHRTDLTALVNESLSYVTIPEKIKVKSHVNGNSQPVNIDAEQIGRVFTNIISNACQSMNGKGALDIDTGLEDPYVWISFKDTGCGIPEENIDKIFEPLYTTKPKGIGLGLAISKRMVEQNGGDIQVDSYVNRGTTFTIRLPMAYRKKE